MRRIFNWTFGSFFRTLGRFIFYILLGFLISLILRNVKIPNFKLEDLILMNVSADIRIPSDVSINDSTSSFNGYQYIGNSTNNSNVDLRVSIVEDMTYAVDHPFLIVDICSSSDIYVDRSSSVGSSCTNSCFSNAVAKMKTTTSCKTNGVGGVIYRVQTQILKWSTGTQFYSLDDKFYVSVPKSGNNYLSVYGVYLSNDDIMVNGYDYSSNFSQIDNTISSKADSIISNQNSNSQAEIDNANQNKEDIINNQNQNTQDVIDNQNANTDKEIESQKVCITQHIDKTNIVFDNRYLSTNGTLINSNNYGVTDFIEFNSITVNTATIYNTSSTCFYNSEKILISCVENKNFSSGSSIPIPSSAIYFRTSIYKSSNIPTFDIKVCKNGNQSMSDYLNDDNTSESTSSASNFFNNFNTNTHGLTGIITAPLSAIQGLTSSSCSPLVLPLPFVNQNLTLPCMRDIYTQYFGGFMQLYDIITLGIISYWVMVRIFGLVKDFKNPEHDEIEVVDL